MSWIHPLGSLFRARRTEGSVLILLWEGLPPAEAVLPRTPFATQHLSARVGRTRANSCLTGGTEGLDPAPQALPLAQQSSDTGSAVFPTSRAETSLNLPAGSWNSSGGGRQGTISAECSSSCRRPCAEVPVTQTLQLTYLEAVQHGDVDLHQGLVLPQRGGFPHIQIHFLGHLL